MQNIKITNSQVCGVYMIINTKNSKIYIGSSTNIYYRIKLHLSHLRRKIHANVYFQRSVEKYGIDNFITFIIDKSDKTEVRILEKYYIDLLKPEYNLVGNTLACEKTKEYREKISNTLKERHKKGELQKYWNTKAEVAINVFSYKKEFLYTFPSLSVCASTLNLNKYTLRTKIRNGTFWYDEYIITRKRDNLEAIVNNFFTRKLNTINRKMVYIPVIHVIDNNSIIYTGNQPFFRCKEKIFKAVDYKFFCKRPTKQIFNSTEGYFTFIGLYVPVKSDKLLENQEIDNQQPTTNLNV